MKLGITELDMLCGNNGTSLCIKASAELHERRITIGGRKLLEGSAYSVGQNGSEDPDFGIHDDDPIK
jgi:hypothetical protein